jgi:radical SAM superfamily enzyme YgiQ (UPF0313 family)
VAKSLYIVNPSSDFPNYVSADILTVSGLASGTAMADSASATVAALAQKDFDVTICDENITPIDFDSTADWIAITGKVNQRRRMFAVADEFRRRGKRVVIGGPYASLSPHHLRPHCDVLVSGEIEAISEELFHDLAHGNPRAEYIGDKPDITGSPTPRWDLYPNDAALMGTLQTSRGCPFECEFCDVIQYLGRKQRHKPIANVLAELDQLYKLGYHTVFLADDNFTAYRARAKELLEAMAWWRKDHPMDFVTQVSIDAARDTELLDMCADAGLTQVFIGIETPNVESLKETGKRQNLRIDIGAQVQKFIDRGISVMGGMIVGFDHDGPDVFATQYEFAQSTAVPIFTLGALTATEATPLYDRMIKEGRLKQAGPETQAVPWGSNIESLTMTDEVFQAGMQNLCNALYSPQAFGERILRLIDTFGRERPGVMPTQFDPSKLRRVDLDAIQVAGDVRKMGEAEGRMWNKVVAAVARKKPGLAPLVTRMLFQYAQARLMFARGNYWDARLSSPPQRRHPMKEAS